jgi:hypothetical protein
MRHGLAIGTAGALLGGSLYLLLIDTTDLPELYVLAGVTVLAALAFAVSREERVAEGSLTASMLHGAWRALAGIPLQIGLVSLEALTQLWQRRMSRGSFRAVPFRAGPEKPRDIGRRGLAEALGSIAPNTIVIGVDPERDLLLVHQLRWQGEPEDLDVLRLGDR